MPKKAKLLWMDLVMTGLDPEKDKILEVAVIATDWEFNPMAEKHEETYLKLCEENKS